MSCILEFAQLVQTHYVTEMDIRRRGIGAILDAQPAPFGLSLFEFFLQVVARNEITRGPADGGASDCDLVDLAVLRRALVLQTPGAGQVCSPALAP